MENSGISWTDHTFNPWMGCTKVSPACKNCYAERDMDHRYGKVKWGDKGTRVLTSDANWSKPLKWNRDAVKVGAHASAASVENMVSARPRVFCASLADVFEDWEGPVLNHIGERLFIDMQGGGDVWFYATKEEIDASELMRQRECRPGTLDDVRARLFRLIDSTLISIGCYSQKGQKTSARCGLGDVRS